MGLSRGQRIAVRQRNLEPGLAATLAPVEGKRWLLTRDFSLIWWSQVLSQVADGVSRLAHLWFVYSVTGSALKTSIIGLLQTLPLILLGPLIGVSVDRLPKKAILIGSEVARAILIGLIPCWVSVELFTVEMLYLLVFLYGIATAMFVPTLSASVPFLVDPTPVHRSQRAASEHNEHRHHHRACAQRPRHRLFRVTRRPLRECTDVPCVGTMPAAGPAPSQHTVAPAKQPGGCDDSRPEGRNPVFPAVPTDHSDSHPDGVPVYVWDKHLHHTIPGVRKKLFALGPVEVGYLWSWLGVGLFLVSLALTPLTRWGARKRVQVVSMSSVIGGAALCGLV